MYDLIEAKRSTRKLYTESLIGRGDITMEEAEAALRDYQRQLERAFTETREAVQRPAEPGAVVRPEPEERPVNHTAVPTAISADAVKQVIETQVSMPDGFTPHPRLQPQLARRAAMIAEDSIDWATGELLAFGGLLLDGRPGPARRPGQPPRHVRPAARGRGRPAERQRVHAAQAVRQRVQQVLRVRLAAVGVRRGGLRVRLLGGAAGRAGVLGSPVRRLLRRRPVDHRRVHQRGRAEVGPALRCGPAAAARLRGPGPGPLVRADRALPAPCARRTT